jgi:hypothetical protein
MWTNHQLPNVKSALFYAILLAGLIPFYKLSHAESMVVRYPIAESEKDKRYEYPKQLLRLALEKTANTHGPYSVVDAEKMAAQMRNRMLLKNGKNIDIIWVPENGELDKDFLPVRIPLLKGILGYRVFLIRESDQSAFSVIRKIDDLRNFTAGFGHDWPDVRILKANRIPLDLAPKYELLFRKLVAGRFDYFPRGINEAWVELEQRKKEYPAMAVENSILMYYPFPVYFIVNKNNTRLADRVEKGLLRAIADSSFNDLFLKYHAAALKNVNFAERKLFKLKNPFLPSSTPDDKRFWFDPVDKPN